MKIVSVATDGLEAVRKCKEIEPDVVLMDLGLPEMNGFEATRQIRLDSPHSKILFLTEHRGPDLIRACFEVGASAYVLKSDTNSDLMQAIRAVLLGRQFVSHSLRQKSETFDSRD